MESLNLNRSNLNPLSSAASPSARPRNEFARIQDALLRRELAVAEQLLRALPASPIHAESEFLWGVLSSFRNQIGKAVEHFRRTLQMNPRHTDAAVCLAVILNDIGKYEDAKKVFELANQSITSRRAGEIPGVDRKFAVKHLELADLYFRYRRYDEAIEEYRKAAALDPQNQEIRIRLAKAYAKKGYLTRAVQELQQITREDPRQVHARMQLGLLHLGQGNALDAELEWQAVLKLDPENAEAKSLIARLDRENPPSI